MNLTISKEVKVGVLALISGSLLYLGFNFLKGISFFKTTLKYHAIYNHVDGLKVSNPVLINGLEVGRVYAIQLDAAAERIIVTLEMNEKLPIGDSTLATLASSDLLGSKAIILKLGKNSKLYESNDTLRSNVEKGFTEAFSEKVFPIVGKLDSTVYRVNNLIDNKTKANLDQIMENMNHTSVALRKITETSQADFKQITYNLALLSSSLTDTEKKLKPVIENLDVLTDSLSRIRMNATVNELNRTLTEVNTLLAQINSGKGSMGKLVKNDSLYTNLNNSALDLDRLLIDLKARPQRYLHFSVFGSKEK